ASRRQRAIHQRDRLHPSRRQPCTDQSNLPSLVAVGAKGSHLPSPPAAPFVQPGVDRHVLHTSAAAPVEWILLFLAIIALALAGWLWSSWSRSRPPSAPAV